MNLGKETNKDGSCEVAARILAYADDFVFAGDEKSIQWEKAKQRVNT